MNKRKRKNVHPHLANLIRFICWVFEGVNGIMLGYGFIELTAKISSFGARFSVRVFGFPMLLAIWGIICLAILMIREELIDEYL